MEGWVDLGTAVSVQPVLKATYRSDFCENTNFCLQRDSNLGPLAQQASVLPLDHCDLQFIDVSVSMAISAAGPVLNLYRISRYSGWLSQEHSSYGLRQLGSTVQQMWVACRVLFVWCCDFSVRVLRLFVISLYLYFFHDRIQLVGGLGVQPTWGGVTR